MKFGENAAKLLGIPYSDVASMGTGLLMLRLSVYKELKDADNEHYKKTGEIGNFADRRIEEEKLLKELEHYSGEQLPRSLTGDKMTEDMGNNGRGLTQMEMQMLRPRILDEMKKREEELKKLRENQSNS